MALYSKQTRVKPDRVLAKAVAYFGPGGLGLEVCIQDPCSVSFTGGGGHVTISTSSEGRKTSIELETREFDYQVKEFMRSIVR